MLVEVGGDRGAGVAQPLGDDFERLAGGQRRGRVAVADPMERRGYQVFHDLAVPGSPANVDHLVVGPSGVYVIDSKRYRGRLRYVAGRLWHGGRTLDRTLATLVWEATQIAETLSSTRPRCGPPCKSPARPLSPEQVALVAGLVRAAFQHAA
jgi:Nuclease-related domain